MNERVIVILDFTVYQKLDYSLSSGQLKNRCQNNQFICNYNVLLDAHIFYSVFLLRSLFESAVDFITSIIFYYLTSSMLPKTEDSLVCGTQVIMYRTLE